ncbi:UNVERIFIED_CONTAM: hypothetical protein FKN15_063542 [Acipenser sinensis]
MAFAGEISSAEYGVEERVTQPVACQEFDLDCGCVQCMLGTSHHCVFIFSCSLTTCLTPQDHTVLTCTV